MLPCTLAACLLGNILAGKVINRAGEGPILKRQGRGIVKSGYENKKFLKTTIKNKNNFECCLILYLILKYKNNVKIKLDLVVFILEIIYQK